MHWLEQELRRELGRKDRDALDKLKRGELTVADGFVVLGHKEASAKVLERLCRQYPDELGTV